MQTDDRPPIVTRIEQTLAALTTSLALVVIGLAATWWVLDLASPI
jgi:hypothetical protein